MLSGISKAARNWMAMSFIALYALCIAAPTAAVAFNAAPCLPEQSAMTQIHVHASDSGHKHATADQHEHSNAGHHEGGDDHGTTKCCGAAFFSAIAPNFELSLAPTILRAASLEGRSQAFTGLTPDKLIRPPKSLS